MMGIRLVNGLSYPEWLKASNKSALTAHEHSTSRVYCITNMAAHITEFKQRCARTEATREFGYNGKQPHYWKWAFGGSGNSNRSR